MFPFVLNGLTKKSRPQKTTKKIHLHCTALHRLVFAVLCCCVNTLHWFCIFVFSCKKIVHRCCFDIALLHWYCTQLVLLWYCPCASLMIVPGIIIMYSSHTYFSHNISYIITHFIAPIQSNINETLYILQPNVSYLHTSGVYMHTNTSFNMHPLSEL